MEVRIREAMAADVEALARLSGQLDYPAEAPESATRLQGIVARGAGVVFVAEAAGGLIAGYAHVFVEHSMVDEPKAQVAELVVEESCRSRGVGATLLRAAEAWARERGLAKIRVNSNVTRERAHRFYLREEYKDEKRQTVFVKELA